VKFELDQVIHYMHDNKPHSAPVLARMQVDNLHEEWVCNKTQQGLFAPFGPGGVYYQTCHGKVNEKEAYASKQEMLTALLAE